MNAELEDLAEALCEADDYIYGLLTPDEADHYRKFADVVLAAGYRKPHNITTPEALDALPFLTVIRDDDGNVHERLEWNYGPTLQWVSDGAEDSHPKLPATVLYQPEETEA